MSYNPVSDEENARQAISERKKMEICSGSDTEIETGQFDVDESTSFLGQKLEERVRHSGPANPQALAADQIEYRMETTYASVDSPASQYQGWPNDENDRLWEEYEKGNRVHIDQKMAEKLPYMTEHVPLEGYEDEYVVGLSVFHYLHCLNAIRKGFYPRRYNSSLLDDDGNVDYHKWIHIDHCIETIRRALTCQADTAAMTFDWIEDSSLVIHSEMLHTCRNFDLIRDWAYERYVPVHQRSHVENGKVVEYADKPYGPAWEKVKVVAPQGWAYTGDDM
ncbi:hypothetical protein SLS53_004344 [Cytospora paraplurivora]|uniref:Tat pathway signal sequence n=1 Tax=Cytospora paraplurivora TaxID=2898453 RepID=A0AAN9U813_9PEZI